MNAATQLWERRLETSTRLLLAQICAPGLRLSETALTPERELGYEGRFEPLVIVDSRGLPKQHPHYRR